jgi:hypothetical protein
MLRILMLVLALASCLTSPVFATTERGDHLFEEGGGAAGIPGLAGPLGAPGLAGAAGAAGIQGIPGIPGAPGILDFSDFFALMGPDNAGPISGGSAVAFPRIGSTTGAIAATGPTTFVLPTIGTYLVQFQVDVTAAAQLQLSLNTIPLPDTVVGRATGTTQIIGVSLVTTSSSGSILQVINPPTNVALALPPNDGGTHPISAHLVIIRIQ